MPAKAPKPKPIEILSLKRTRKTIEIAWRQGDAEFDLSERDNPLPSFTKAVDALAPIVSTICHLPAPYAEAGLRVVGFKVGEQSGAQTVSLKARKDIDDAAKEFVITTPERLLAHPAEPGKYTPPLSKEEAGLVEEAIEQAKLYVKGERAQGQIAFDDEEDGDGEGDNAEGQELPFQPAPPAEAPAKKPRQKKK